MEVVVEQKMEGYVRETESRSDQRAVLQIQRNPSPETVTVEKG